MPQEPMMPPMQQMPPMPPQPMSLYRSVWPRWLSKYAVGGYLAALAVVTMMYLSHSLPWYYMLSGIVEVLVFFLYGSTVIKETAIDRIRKTKNYEKRLFLIAFIPRLIWMLLIYSLFMINYGNAFGFEDADATFYHDLGCDFSAALNEGYFLESFKKSNEEIDLSDLGYATYVGFIYWLTGNSIIAVRLLKCIWSSLTVVLIYRLAKRNFGEQTARIAAIFCALWPNFWYYCGAHLKETEMAFLAVLFVEQADQMLCSRKFTAWKVIPVLLIAAAMFTFRTPLGLVALLALVFSVAMSSSKVVNRGKRIVVGFFAIALIGIVAGNRIEEKSRGLLENVRSNQQESNMEWRSRRTHGNAFAKYAGSAVFAPMIFTIPFPTMVRPFEGQEVQQLNNGGNFIKNIISGFTILALVMLLLSGRWREHLLPLSYMLGYLVVLVFSSFAQSERFHQPIMPFEFMFAAYGLSIALSQRKYKQWYMYWCVIMFVAAIGWSWFKLAGRGLA